MGLWKCPQWLKDTAFLAEFQGSDFWGFIHCYKPMLSWDLWSSLSYASSSLLNKHLVSQQRNLRLLCLILQDDGLGSQGCFYHMCNHSIPRSSFFFPACSPSWTHSFYHSLLHTIKYMFTVFPNPQEKLKNQKQQLFLKLVVTFNAWFEIFALFYG